MAYGIKSVTLNPKSVELDIRNLVLDNKSVETDIKVFQKHSILT